MFIPTPSTLKRLVRICTLTGHLADIGRRPPLTRTGQFRKGGARRLRPGTSDVNLFRYGEGVVNFDA
jgi:hypothetical protein